MKHIKRHLSENILFSLENSPVVFVNGPRQAGKSTLVQRLAQGDFPAEYVTLDSATQMSAAATSPEAFLTQRMGKEGSSLIIDEVQMVPELFRVLKQVVDDLRMTDKSTDKSTSNGRFLLTGSANIMALPKLSDPLVGRMNVKTLYPLAGCEVFGGEGHFLKYLFDGKFPSVRNSPPLNEVMRAATFPEISGKSARQRNEWFDGYLMTILQRDVRMIAELEKISLLPAMLRLLATRAGSLVNDADISRSMGLNAVTGKSYRGILQAMFLTFDVSPWFRNIGKRLVKSPKGYLMDSLLLCHLLEWNLDDLSKNKPDLYGHVVENFVATELVKLRSFSDIRAKLLHFRTSDGKEVDFVLERPNGTLAGIEVKSASRVDSGDFKGLKILQQATGDDFACGIVLYAGEAVVPFGENLLAVPLSALWQ
jgi:hypothetical protein